jgi:TonB family protein
MAWSMHASVSRRHDMRIDNIVKIAIPALVFGACSASATRGAGTPASVGDLVAANPAEQILAAVENPRLPDADQAYAEIRHDAGDEATATVELCVAPDGHVDRVELRRPSASSAYDRAVVKDVAEWQFGGKNWTPANADTCELATIKYDLQL